MWGACNILKCPTHVYRNGVHFSMGSSLSAPCSLMWFLSVCLSDMFSQGNLKTFLVRHQWEQHSFKQRGLVVSMACDIARGVAYLHSISIAHK